jgi:hypothetical protein
VAPLGIRVNASRPGYVTTDMASVDEPQFRRHWIDDVPMQRYASPDEIAPTVLFLASDASAFMTGLILVIDGGYTRCSDRRASFVSRLRGPTRLPTRTATRRTAAAKRRCRRAGRTR